MSDIENLTIMFTDIVEYSKMVSKLSRKESAWLLKQHDKILKRIIKRFGGNIIKSLGDAFLVTFRSPTDSILCAMAIQDSVWEFNQDTDPANPLEVRIAINTGEVRLSDNDVFGEAVNIASRLESITPANNIYLTESVRLSMHKSEASLEPVGNQSFKGVDYPIMVYSVAKKAVENTEQKHPFGGAHIYLKPAGQSKFSFGKLFLTTCATIITAFFTWWLTINYMPPPGSVGIEKLTVELGELPSLETPENLATPENEVTELDDLSYAQSQDYVKEKNYLLLKKLVDDNIEIYPRDAYLNMLQGHVQYYFKNYKASIAAYKTALEAKPALANNSLLAENLVELIDIERLEANELIGQYLSNPMITALSKRSGQEGLRGRYDAFYILKDSGNLKQVDKVGLNIWDLRELNSCKLKKVAATELKRLKDPRALDALQEIKNRPFHKRFKDLCLTTVVNSAIRDIEGADENNSEKNTKQKP